MRTPGWVSPVSSVPYTSVHSMVTRAGPWSQVSLALLASLLLAPLVSADSWIRGGWPGRSRGLALWVQTHNVMTSDTRPSHNYSLQRGVRSGYSSPLAEPEPSFGRRFYNPGLGYRSPLAEPEPSSLRLPFLRNIPVPEPEPEPEPAPTLGRVFPVVNKNPAPPRPSFATVATPSVSSDPPRSNPLPVSAPAPVPSPSPTPLSISSPPVPAVPDTPPQDIRTPELRSLPIFEDEIVFEAG